MCTLGPHGRVSTVYIVNIVFLEERKSMQRCTNRLGSAGDHYSPSVEALPAKLNGDVERNH